ncbi:MAG: hypothetical protein ACLQAT_13460 [Candidatus Binataceae bacterium]
MADERLPGGRRITLGAYKAYDTRDFVAGAARSTSPRTWRRTKPGAEARPYDARTVRHRGNALSRWIRKQVEEAFGWMKTVA